MDPLSITVGVASLLKLTGSIAWELKKFHDDAKEVDKHLKTVLRDVERFNVVLHSMRDTFSNITAQTTTGFAGALWKNVAQSLEDGVGVLQEFDGKLKVINKETRWLNSARKQIRLNFADGDIAAFREQITSFRDCLSLSMSTIILHNQFFNPAAQEPKQPTIDLDQLETEIRRTAHETNQKIQALQDLLSFQPTSLAVGPDMSSVPAADPAADDFQALRLMISRLQRAIPRDEKYVRRLAPENQSAEVSSSSRTTEPSVSSGSSRVHTLRSSDSQSFVAAPRDRGTAALQHDQPVQPSPEPEDAEGEHPTSSHAGSSLSNAQRSAEPAEAHDPKRAPDLLETETASLQSRVVVLTNLRNCVQASAEIVSNASSVAASEQVRDNMSVVAGSDFGDCFPPVRNLAMKRWLDSATINEDVEDGAERPASATGSEASDGSEGGTELDHEITAALIGAAIEKREQDDQSAAERILKDVLVRTGREVEMSQRRAHQESTRNMRLEANSYLHKIYETQSRWHDCKVVWLSIMEDKQKLAAVGSQPLPDDLIVLADILYRQNELVECRLYARQALQISKRAHNRSQEERSLQLLVETYQEGESEHAAYSFMLKRLALDLENSVGSQKDAVSQAPDRRTQGATRGAVAAGEVLLSRSVQDQERTKNRPDSRPVIRTHQTGLSDLLGPETNNSTASQRELLNGTLSGRLLDGLDVENLTAEQEDELTGRIADVYRQQQRSRTQLNSNGALHPRTPSNDTNGLRLTPVVEEKDADMASGYTQHDTHLSNPFAAKQQDGPGHIDEREGRERRAIESRPAHAHHRPHAEPAPLSHAEMERRLAGRPSKGPPSINPIWMTTEHNRHMMHTGETSKDASAGPDPAMHVWSSWGPVDTQKRLQELSVIDPALRPENLAQPSAELEQSAQTRSHADTGRARKHNVPMTTRKSPVIVPERSQPKWLHCPVTHCTDVEQDVDRLYRHVQTVHQPGFDGTVQGSSSREPASFVAPKDSFYSRYLVCPADSHPGDTLRRHIAFVGCSGSGKSALISAWRYAGDLKRVKATVIQEDIVKFETRDHQPMTVTLTEIGGEYDYETGIASRPVPDLVVICYDIAAPVRCRYPYTGAMSAQLKDAPFILVACKGDLAEITGQSESLSMDDEAYYGYIDDLSIASFVTSARQQTGLKDLFDFILNFVVVNDIVYHNLQKSYAVRRQRIVAQRMKGGSLADLHPEPRYNEVVTATYDFEAATLDELSFKEGDEIHVLEPKYKDWWMGRLNGRTGIFPTNYIKRAT